MNKKKMLLLFLLLSITPFIRGCAETFGFPLPAMFNVIEPGSFSETWNKLLAKLSSLTALLIILVNVLFAVLFTRVFARNASRLKWIPHFMIMLAIGIAMIWLMALIYQLGIDTDDPKTMIENISAAYGNIFGKIYYTIPLKAGEEIVKSYPWGIKALGDSVKKGVVETLSADILNRAWFVVVTFIGGWVLRGFSGIVRKVYDVDAKM